MLQLLLLDYIAFFCGTVVERRSLAGELSRPARDM